MKIYKLLCLMMIAVLLLSGCKAPIRGEERLPQSKEEVAFDPNLPDTVRLDENGVPRIRVYVTSEKQIQEMDIETYLWGVLAGEMKNDWPQEALKAQAILARTFVIKFLSEKQSKYEGADISTDIEEAQAYNADEINENVKRAVEETRGLIVAYQGEPIYAWFHAHSGGRTAQAGEGLSYKDEAPYTQSVKSTEDEAADGEARAWTASFDPDEVLEAAKECGVKAGDRIESIAAGEKGESGRSKYVEINGKNVPANELRIALGSTKVKSTLLTSVSFMNGKVVFSGKGYGHGVGMSQWGAYAMAKEGKTANEIIHYYYRDVNIVQKWR